MSKAIENLIALLEEDDPCDVACRKGCAFRDMGIACINCILLEHNEDAKKVAQQLKLINLLEE